MADNKSKMVAKDNKLINASYLLGVAEQRLIFLAIVEAREQKKLIDARGVLQIRAKTYQEQFKVEKHSAYIALKNASRDLIEAKFEYDDIHEETGKKAHYIVNWVQKITYVDDAGLVELQFTDAVIPLITRLSEKYTEYELKQVSELQSEYAIRLYELMMQWKKVGKTNEIEINALRKKLGVEPDQYQRMNNFKARVLDYAITQINEHTDINASYEQHKQGRRITGFTFKFKIKKKKENTGVLDVTESITSDRIITSDKQIKPLNEKQAQMFSNLMGNDSVFGGKYARPGESVSVFINRLKRELQTIEGMQHYVDELRNFGYK